jgi:RNA polymerase sigma factor (sigma-70 family)
MPTITTASRGQLPADADAAIRELYSRHAKALHGYVQRFCPDPASADDIVQETLIRAWRHLPQLTADDLPVRPWLFRVVRNLLTDADRAARPGHHRTGATDVAGDDAGLTDLTGNPSPTRSSTCRTRTGPCWWSLLPPDPGDRRPPAGIPDGTPDHGSTTHCMRAQADQEREAIACG